MSYDRYHRKALGARPLHPETLMLGYGYDPALSEGAVTPPVFLTSTFVFTSAEHGKAFFDYVSGQHTPRQARRQNSSTRASIIPAARSSRTGWPCSRVRRPV